MLLPVSVNSQDSENTGSNLGVADSSCTVSCGFQ